MGQHQPNIGSMSRVYWVYGNLAAKGQLIETSLRKQNILNDVVKLTYLFVSRPTSWRSNLNNYAACAIFYSFFFISL